MGRYAVGIDDGYANAKLVTKDKSFSVPSRAREGIMAVSGFGGESVSGVYRTDGGVFTVDPTLTDTVDTRSDSYPFSGMNRAIVMYALEKAGFTGDDEIILVTGLPIRDYYSKTGRNEDKIRRKSQQFDHPIEAMDGHPLPKIIDHIVSSEGVSAWLTYVKEKGLSADEAESTRWVGVVDIGGNTTDVAVISPRNKMVDHAHSGSESMGVMQVHDRIRIEIQNKFGVRDVSFSFCDDALHAYTKTGKGSVRLQRETFDLTEIIESAIKPVAQNISYKVRQIVGPMMAELERLIVVGGGANLFRSGLDLDGFEIPESPEFANAKGMYIRASYALSQKE